MNKTKALTQAGIMIALSQILSYVKFVEMPQGGSVTVASMVPVIFYSLLWGPKYGILACTVYGFLQFALGGVMLHPMSILIDYILAFGLLGIAGFFNKSFKSALFGTTLAILLRYLMHFISGVTLFYMYAPEGQPVWLYSLVYNSFMLVELVISLPPIAFLYKRVIEKGLVDTK
ncbi:putative proton-coupled thiamine transporter YuaJ [Peptoniphilus sp. ING2-D1G]|nr:putative proton-coupled thiamine transporter YuaJ [Peptoniphilus sp. ING2-D1G]